MKKIITILLFTSFAQNIFSMCGDRGLWVFPQNTDISQNSWFMLETYRASQEITDKLNKDYPIYLISGKHKVKLIVVSRHQGMFDISQVILKPENELKPGKTYELVIENLDEEQQEDIQRWNSSKEKTEKITWTTKNKKDTKAPEWKKKPKFLNTECKHFGCGPELFAVFDYEINDESEVLIKTEFTSIKTGKTKVYYLTAKDKKIKVGHGMCSGAFTFGNEKANKKFKVRFALLDASGNELNKFTEPIEFKNPYKAFEIPDENTGSYPIEKLNDILGRYTKRNNKEFWIFYFNQEEKIYIAKLYIIDDDFIDSEYTIEKISKNTAEGSFNIKMKDVSGEIVPSWNLNYNTDTESYNLVFHTYDYEKDLWEDIVYKGNKKEEVYEKVDEIPKFSDGKITFEEYIKRELIYPELARENDITGTVFTKFVVKSNGSIGKIVITKSVDMILTNEALRIVINLPKFTPGKKDGRNVSVWYSLPIVFKLDE